MKCSHWKVFIATVLTAACSQAPSNAMIEAAKASVKLCSESFVVETGLEFSRDPERAYVHVYGNYFGVSIAIGELGTFDEASSDYEMVFACYLIREPEARVVYMAEPLSKPLVGTDDVLMEIYSQIRGELDDGSVTEMLFLLEDDGPRFFASQPFSVENFAAHNEAIR